MGYFSQAVGDIISKKNLATMYLDWLILKTQGCVQSVDTYTGL